MRLRDLFYLLFATYAASSLGQEAHDEKSLWQLALKESPRSTQIELGLEKSRLHQAQAEDLYGVSLRANAGYMDSNEKPLSQMSPVFAPTSQGDIGVYKAFSRGMTASVIMSANQRSTTNHSMRRHTRNQTEVQVTMDLWRNLLGKLDQARLDEAHFLREKSEAQSMIHLKGLQVEVRKIYWSLVAAEESIKASDKLLTSAKRQLNEARRRYHESVATAAEVARLRAQVASRQNIIVKLRYQKVQYEKALANFIPSLNEVQLSLKPVDFKAVMEEIEQCVDVIATRPKDPLIDSGYGPLLTFLEQSYEAKKVLSASKSDMDIKLIGSYKIIGSKANSKYGETTQEMFDNGARGSYVGLQLNVPLGSTKNRLASRLSALERLSYRVEKEQIIANLRTQKESIVPLIKLLNEALVNQKSNSALLSRSVRDIERQYRQARLSLSELIREQDALQDSQLKEIDSNLLVIHTILEHFKVFTRLPCTLNHSLS